MAALPFRPTPFFANKNQAFWNLQLAGWGGATLLRAMSALANGQPPDRLVIILIATITGFSISLILAVVYSQLIKKPVMPRRLVSPPSPSAQATVASRSAMTCASGTFATTVSTICEISVIADTSPWRT